MHQECAAKCIGFVCKGLHAPFFHHMKVVIRLAAHTHVPVAIFSPPPPSKSVYQLVFLWHPPPHTHIGLGLGGCPCAAQARGAIQGGNYEFCTNAVIGH